MYIVIYIVQISRVTITKRLRKANKKLVEKLRMRRNIPTDDEISAGEEGGGRGEGQQHERSCGANRQGESK